MKSGTKWLIGILVVIGIIIIWVVGLYNSLIVSQQRVETARADIETQLQRRLDLIPNLVSTVKGYATQEKEIYTDIANARSRLAGAGNITEQAEANNDLSGALSRLLLVVENYPQLKSNQSFHDLSVQLEGTENRLAESRRAYNESAKEFNVSVRKFPTNIVAGIFGFERKTQFEAQAGAEQAPTVNF